MSSEIKARRTNWDVLVLVGIAVAARVLFLVLTHGRAMSSDLRAWLVVGRVLGAGQDPYAKTTILNFWPPLWAQVLSLLQSFSSLTGTSLENSIRAFLVAADCCFIAATASLLRRWRYPWTFALLLVGICLNPISILLTCQHGNFDVLVGLVVLLFLKALDFFDDTRDSSYWLLACFFLGIGVVLKSIPILLAPLLLSGTNGIPQRIRWLGAFLTIGPVVYGLSIISIVHPGSIVRSALGYRSLPGWFGITGLMHLFRRDSWIRPYSYIFTGAVCLAMVFLAWRVRRQKPSREQRILLVSTSLMAIPVFGPGYGPQYICWFWPSLLLAYALGSRHLRRTLLLFGGIAAVTYVVQYAFAESLGAFLLQLSPTPEFQVGAFVMRSNRAMTLVSLPLFLAYGVTFVVAVRETWSVTTARASERAAT